MRPLTKGDPRQIGPFRIVGLLGGGGMGRVYLGRAADGRTVAVKTARSELADDRGFRTRFAREVAAARRVGGPFVAPVVDAAPHDDVPWMATDYVPGVSLTDAVHDCGALPERAVRLLTAGLLQALAAVHAHGLVHRDLKPSNILLTAEGPRVIDFGIAYSAADTALTTTGTALGTPGFMAPEQLVMTGPNVTGAADVFALGGVIVFAATGAGPYGSAEPQILMYRTVHEEPRLDGLPDGLSEVAAACLAKEPERRPALPALMARVGAPGPYGDWLPAPVAVQLRRLSAQLADPRSAADFARPPAQAPAGVPFDQLPTSARPDGPPPPPSPVAKTAWPAHTATPPPPAAPAPSRRRVLAALSVVGGLAGTGALGWALWPEGEDRASGATAGDQPAGSPEPSRRLPQEIRDKGTITVGSDIAYAPMEFVRDGKPAGVDVDLAHALGRELGVRVTFENAVFDSLLAGLAAGRFDLVMSAMADTKGRQQGRAGGTKTGSGVDLVDYFRAGLVLVVRKGNPEGIHNPADLSGRTVAVQRGSVARDYVDALGRKAAKGIRIREFDSQAEVYDDIAKGRSSAGLDDFPVAAQTAATLSGGGVLELAGEQLDPLLYGIAVAKNRVALRDALRGALDVLIKNGEYAKILKKWYVEGGAVRRAVVNGGA
ncbi:bifunctional serine/threonine-protein kinase/transporter substrate-binding domain-containing protein [Streptomyces endophytica]|uniref:Bifunctional serine/threonine-protein kinase/transporter substrate-binding domain-containing protein n=1 Tax=Streptomyces endophytica TaxID=2991496 RepID=A0ABY6PHQ5_9ACTN|nr:bifunctional serine/threonine-protein kinase/transporter substrate-binding domain-containing protein [Streptomyces endophytica]UZJ32975.1 bifunctional serine/threonine-protein kinase/transporter substrate-binding domain-containing protein [Streptomyces endophytica]